jgi:hypothetical protein
VPVGLPLWGRAERLIGQILAKLSSMSMADEEM